MTGHTDAATDRFGDHYLRTQFKVESERRREAKRDGEVDA